MNNPNDNESLQGEFKESLNNSDESKINAIEENQVEVRTTALANTNYDYNNTNKHEGTNHTQDNLLTNNITIDSNIKDLDYLTSEIGANEKFSNNSKISSFKINNQQQQPNELQPTHDSSSSNKVLLAKNHIFSSSINQLYLNKSNNLKEINSINHNYDINNRPKYDDTNSVVKSFHVDNADSNLFYLETNTKQDKSDSELNDEQVNTKGLDKETSKFSNLSNKKFNLPNFLLFSNNNNNSKNLDNESLTSIKTQLIILNNPNPVFESKIASPTSNQIKSHFKLMHSSSFSPSSSSLPPPSLNLNFVPPSISQQKTTSVFDSSGIVETRGTFSAAPAGVKGLNRKHEIDSEVYNDYDTKTTNTFVNRSTESSGFNVNNNNNNAAFFSSSSSNNQNNTNNNFNSAMFHPTWDEWKRSHTNEKNNLNNNLNESISFTKINSDNFSNKQKTKNESNDNKNTSNTSDSIEKNTTTRSFIEETIRHKNNYNSNNQHHQQQQKSYQNNYTVPNTNYQVIGPTTTAKSSEMYFSKNSPDVYNPPSPIVINDSTESYSGSKRQQHYEQTHSSKREQHLNQTKKMTNTTKSSINSPRHYPVYPFDAQPNRAPSPVRLSSIVLAKQPPIEVEVKDFKIDPPPQPEPQQPKKIKTIMSTQKRKESAPNLTGWRTESDSDTEIQNRLLAKASGSIPIEYISIRRDPKPHEKRAEKNKKSITTGTNTSTERGKRIASTNTNQDELPQYNLHVSLDSLFVKSRREASTSTERKNKNAATETDIKQRDACTVTDAEEEPEPPPPPQQYIFRSRKSRYTEWETASTPPEPTYRLEFLTKSPRVVHRRNFQSHQHFHNHVGCLNEDDNDVTDIFNTNVRFDDDDRIIFGSSTSNTFNQNSHQHHHHHEHRSCRRSGSFPSLLMRPVPIIVDNGIQTKRYIKHTHSTNYTPLIQQHQFSSFTPQIGILPLRTSNGCLNNENWNQQFEQFNSKFSDVFGHQNCIQQIEPKTQRFGT